MARNRRRVKRQTVPPRAHIRKAIARVDVLASALDAIETEMPHWEPGWWLQGERIAAADSLAEIESDIPVLKELGQALEDGDALNDTTSSAAAARRAVAALYQLLDDIEGMDYVADSGFLNDLVGDSRLKAEADVARVEKFLEDVITRALDDAWDSRDAAIDRESAIVAIQSDPTVVNAEGKVHLSNSPGTSHRYISVRSLEGTSAQAWCREFADDAADVIVSAVSELDDPIEARERLGNADRSLFTNDLLRQATIDVILGHAHSSIYDRYEAAATHVEQLIESTRDDLAYDPSAEDVEKELKGLDEAAMELLRVARAAAAHRSALAALEDALLRKK